MKKFCLLFISFIFTINIVLASDDIKSCFSLTSSFKVDSGKNEIFLLNSSSKLDYILNNQSEVYFRYYKENKVDVLYKVDFSKTEQKFLQDKNSSTKVNFDTSINNTIVIDFLKNVSGINPTFDFDYNNYDLFVSQDNKTFKKVYLNDIPSLTFRYLKINFLDYNKTSKVISISDLYFEKITYKYLVKSIGYGTYDFYSNFTCQNNEAQSNIYSSYLNSLSSATNFSFKNGLKENVITFGLNSLYESTNSSDIDSDLVFDTEDNCKDIYNPNQLDTDGNGIGDLCDDDDRDSIIGEKDNCTFIYNPDQKDINSNGVGDVCEFDKDNDGVFDSKDNCINTPNSDQKDTDSDGIGDACDNCSLYNPTQLDKNTNNIGDTCEESEKQKIENDDDKDGILNFSDNCKSAPNSDQKDSDGDLVGDMCDNCKTIKNFEQDDKNNNKVGDMCEDSDSDTIIGYLDNCINETNNDQKDSDNNGIGDVCEDSDGDNIINVKDNCPYAYNPDQKDVDEDKIGNSCDQKDDRFIESNKDFFIILIAIISIFFIGGIYYMFKKLQEKDSK